MEDRELIEDAIEQISEHLESYQSCFVSAKNLPNHLLAGAYAEFCATLRQLKAALMGLEP